MQTEPKTCLWCSLGKDCLYYQTVIAPECVNLLGQEEAELRQYIAENCPDYSREPMRFFFFSDPAHTPYTEADYNKFDL